MFSLPGFPISSRPRQGPARVAPTKVDINFEKKEKNPLNRGCPRPLCCPSYCQVAPATPPARVAPARVALRRPLRDPVTRPGPRRRSCQKRPGWAREAHAPAGGRAFRAWPSPFCHMNELGSGIVLEGVLSTVWVKQIVPLPVDPGKCRLKQ